MSYSIPIPVLAPHLYVAARSGGGTDDHSSPLNMLVGSKSGSSVPNWRKKVALSQPAGSAYSFDRYSVQQSNASFETRFKFTGNNTEFVDTFKGNVLAPVTFPHNFSLPPEVEAKALAKLIQKIRNQRSETNGLILLGEGRQTLQMLRHPLDSFVKAVYAREQKLKLLKGKIEKVNVRKRRDAWMEVVTGTWLEAVFGWKPLLSDIGDILKTIDRYRNSPPKKDRLVSKASLETSSIVASGKVRLSGLYLYVDTIQQTTTNCEVKYTVGMESKERFDDGSLSRLLELSGFTLENFVPALWEITPWSFLIDYFLNMGKFLEAATTDFSDVKWIVKTVGFRSARLRTQQIESPQTNIQADGNIYLSHSGTPEYQLTIRTTVDRTVPSTLGLPPFAFSHPGNSPVRLANLLALLDQQRRSNRDLSWLSIKGR